ncbi:hypothetical protein GOODEAATRI_020920, partial [Goodea atripinnis]
QAAQESPVILMPNHRSYVDFLVVSYILFSYDIPLPVIAAGIRKYLFNLDQSISGFAPLEFFVEGLRSRTLKSLPPKLGMMHMILEPFLKGEVYDVTLVPISISYDRVLEESLLAHELLGVPKPRESTTGLLKASKVLRENYGCMHVNFGRPLSVRQLCEGKLNRSQYNLIPRDLPQKPNAETEACGSWLAHMIVRIQEEGTLTSPWSLMACVLLQVPTAALTEEGLLFHQLTEQTLWLRKLALDFGAHLSWPDELLTCFCFLQELFSNEFIFIPGRSSQDFDEACSLLKKCKAVHVSLWDVTVSDTGLAVLSFLQELLKPFIDSYQVP